MSSPLVRACWSGVTRKCDELSGSLEENADRIGAFTHPLRTSSRSNLSPERAEPDSQRCRRRQSACLAFRIGRRFEERDDLGKLRVDRDMINDPRASFKDAMSGIGPPKSLTFLNLSQWSARTRFPPLGPRAIIIANLLAPEKCNVKTNQVWLERSPIRQWTVASPLGSSPASRHHRWP